MANGVMYRNNGVSAKANGSISANINNGKNNNEIMKVISMKSMKKSGINAMAYHQ
jgi:hypothetical protein